MAKTKTLPKKLYIKVEGEGEESYWTADTDLIGLTELGTRSKIGLYQLVEVAEVQGIVSSSFKKLPGSSR